MYISGKFLSVLILLGAAFAAASPYLTLYQMKVAAEDRDSTALSAYVEFPSVRQSLKDQMNAVLKAEMAKEMKDNPLAAIGTAFAGLMVNSVVGAYVTPDGITALMKGEKLNTSGGPDSDSESSERKPFDDAQARYLRWDKFQVSMTDESGEQILFKLSRRGIGWKLTEILLPITE